MHTDIKDALAFLERDTPEGVEVGRIPAVAASANSATAEAHTRDLAEHPRWWARFGGKSCTISRDVYLLMKSKGAVEGAFYKRVGDD